MLGKQTILDGINLEIKKGKRTVIVGESGSGKSVLVKIIMGLLSPTSGQIQIEGIDLNKAKGKQVLQIKKNISMLFQGSALLDSLSVYQNVALPLFEHRRDLQESQIRKIVAAKLEMVGLEDTFHKMPSELSGGMQKRVALARAIALDPLYIIYDEPTTGLDPTSAKGIIDLINNIHKQGWLHLDNHHSRQRLCASKFRCGGSFVGQKNQLLRKSERLCLGCLRVNLSTSAL